MSEPIKPHTTEPIADGKTNRPEAEKPAYEAPRILKKRSVTRVTLFSGGGTSGLGLTGTG